MSKFTHFAALTSIYFQESLLSFWGHLEVEVRQGLGDRFRIEARIVIHESDADSLKVASGALFRHEGRWHVYRICNSKAELVQVELGASNGLEAEILTGLDEDDLVVLYPTEQIHAGVGVLSN